MNFYKRINAAFVCLFGKSFIIAHNAIFSSGTNLSAHEIIFYNVRVEDNFCNPIKRQINLCKVNKQE